MYARDGREMETVAEQLLRDLCFLDGRDGEWEQAREWLSGFGKLGVHGPFAAMFGPDDGSAEVASVYAEVFHQLGYLDVEHSPSTEAVLHGRAWRGELRTRYEDQDILRSEVEEAFGAPSLVIAKRVLCYAGPTRGARWVSFGCGPRTHQVYEPGKGSYRGSQDPDPLVRSIRVSGDDFETGLILTLYGKVLRWGLGWWIHHPSVSVSESSRAIADQLKQIEADDPSQALRRQSGDESR
jgi:hypothetical protein